MTFKVRDRAYLGNAYARAGRREEAEKLAIDFHQGRSNKPWSSRVWATRIALWRLWIAPPWVVP